MSNQYFEMDTIQDALDKAGVLLRNGVTQISFRVKEPKECC